MTGWAPATEAEIAMRDALRAGDQERYFQILARTELLLPVSADALAGRAPMGWGTWTTGGRTHVLAFTSTEALHACLAEHAGSARKVAYHDLAASWPNLEWWLAVNPGLPVEGYLPAWFVSQLARGDVRLPGRSIGARARLERVESSRARATAAVPPRDLPEQSAPAAAAPVAPPPPVTPGMPAAGGASRPEYGAGAAPPADPRAPLGAPAGPGIPTRQNAARLVGGRSRSGEGTRGFGTSAFGSDRGLGGSGDPGGDRPGSGVPDGGQAAAGMAASAFSTTGTGAPPPPRTAGGPERPEALPRRPGTPPPPMSPPPERPASLPRRPGVLPRRPIPAGVGREGALAGPNDVPRPVGFPAAPGAPAGPGAPSGPGDRPASGVGPGSDSGVPAPGRPTPPGAAVPPYASALVDRATAPASPAPPLAPVTPPTAPVSAPPRSRPEPVSPGQPEPRDSGHPEDAPPEPAGRQAVYSATVPRPPTPRPVEEAPAVEPALRSSATPAPGSPSSAAEAESPLARPWSAPGFIPANEVEEALLAAAGDGSTESFLSTLLLAKVLVPVPVGGSPDVLPGEDRFPWHTEMIDGESYVVVFTSPERLHEHVTEPMQTVVVKFVQLIRAWPDPSASFAVNPGTAVGATLPGAQIIALANWAAEVGLGVDPDVEPEIDTEDPGIPTAPVPALVPTRSSVPTDTSRLQQMQKVIPPSQVDYYIDRGYDRVSGFVHRAAEVAQLRTPAKLTAALGLRYPGSPYQPDAPEVYVLRWPAYCPTLYRIPYGGQTESAMRAMEGWVIERSPFRGNGFAPGEGSEVVAEFKVDSARLPHGAKLVRLGADGSETLVAVLDADQPAWRQVGDD